MQIARSALRPVARLSTEAPLVARQVTSSCSKLPIAAARATTVPALSRAFTSTPIRQLLEEPTDPHPPSRLLRTPLYDFHVQNGGKMVEFAGWDMPLSYGSVGQSESRGLKSHARALLTRLHSRRTPSRSHSRGSLRRLSHASTSFHRSWRASLPFLAVPFVALGARTVDLDAFGPRQRPRWNHRRHDGHQAC